MNNIDFARIFGVEFVNQRLQNSAVVAREYAPELDRYGFVRQSGAGNAQHKRQRNEDCQNLFHLDYPP